MNLKLVWHRTRPLLMSILAVISFLRLFHIGVPTSPPDFQLIFSFLLPDALSAFFLERPLIILTSVIFASAAHSAYRKRNEPFLILSTDIRIDFNEANGSKVSIKEIKKFRTNHPNISAHFMSLGSGSGRIPKNEIYGWVRNHRNENLNARLEIIGDDKNLDIIHICEPCFPFKYVLDLLPQFMRTDYIERCISTTHYDCFRDDEDYYEMLTTRYPHKSITLEVAFHKERRPREVYGQRIMKNGIIKLNPISDIGTEGQVIYSVSFGNSRDERLRIAWKF